MFDLHDLVVTSEDNLVFTHDGTAAYSTDSNFLLISGMASTVTLEYIFAFVAAGGGGCTISDGDVCVGNCGAGGFTPGSAESV